MLRFVACVPSVLFPIAMIYTVTLSTYRRWSITGQVPHGCGTQPKDAGCESEAQVRGREQIKGRAAQGADPDVNEREGRLMSHYDSRAERLARARGAWAVARRA